MFREIPSPLNVTYLSLLTQIICPGLQVRKYGHRSKIEQYTYLLIFIKHTYIAAFINTAPTSTNAAPVLQNILHIVYTNDTNNYISLPLFFSFHLLSTFYLYFQLSFVVFFLFYKNILTNYRWIFPNLF